MVQISETKTNKNYYTMERVTLHIRTIRQEGEINVRFRLRDGRKCDLTYTSDLRADLRDLCKLDSEGRPARYVSKYKDELVQAIQQERETIHAAYTDMRRDAAPMTCEMLRLYVEQIKFGTKGTNQPRAFLERFQKYIMDSEREGIIGKKRTDGYCAVSRMLSRFLTICNMQTIPTAKVSADLLVRFRDFIRNEYRYTAQYPQLYTRCKVVPAAPRNENTVSAEMTIIKTFFSALEETEEIAKSPFRMLGKNQRKTMLRERYDAPVSLLPDELLRLRTAEVPEALEKTRNAFVVQCAFGCRISDFSRLGMRNISVDGQGFAYIHYLSQKTSHAAADYTEVETPVVRYALDIIKGCGFEFGLQRSAEKIAYNAAIRELLRLCGIDRKVPKYNAETGENDYIPVHELGSSKLARKTFVDMMHKVQLNEYAAGLHSAGSDAVHHYTQLTRQDRFALVCAAFGEKPYTVDGDLNYTSGEGEQ